MRPFQVWRPEYGQCEEDGRTIEAFDAECAAADYAEWYDSQGDYDIIGGADATLRVRDVERGDVQTFVVQGESVPHYHARLKVSP